jgi:branched-chain amino acid transport system permease protein
LRVREASAVPVAALPRLGAGWRIAGIAVVAAGIVLVAPSVLDTYTVNILVRAFFVAIVAVTVDVLWGYSGTLTFAQSAFFGLGAYATAIVFTQYGFAPWTVAVAAGAAVAGALLVAGFVGWLSFYPGSTPLYASVVSLVLPIVVVQVLYSGGTFTGSSSGLVGFDSFDLSTEAWFRIAGVAAVVVTAGARVLVRSDAGRLLTALRDNETRCYYLGLNAARLRILLLFACAVLAALSGAGYGAFGGVAAPELASFVFGTQLVIMVALGGRGTLVGAFAGALVIEVASAYLSSSLPFVWELIVGVAFVLVIVALPGGLFGGLVALRRRLGAHMPAASPLALATAAPAAQHHRAEVMVEAVDVSKHFGSLSVLSGVSFAARRGELVSLVGPNGAGKTTLIRCLADGRERSGGEVRIAGAPIHRLPPHRIVALGLGRKFQAASVFETMSVADCLKVARARHETPSAIAVRAHLALPAAAREVVESSGLAEHLRVEARLLSHGLKQALELAMVLALEPQVVLLDEPTAGLTRAERTRFGAILTRLATESRLCILIVEHDLDFVRDISSRIIVLHQGRIALDGSVADVAEAPLVREIYTGGKA